MIDIKRYKELKEKGFVKLTKVPGTVPTIIMVTRRFSPDDGQEIDSEITPLKIADLKTQLSTVGDQLKGLADLIADCEAAA